MLFSDDDALFRGVDAYNSFLAEVWAGKQSELEARAAKAVLTLVAEEDRLEAVDDLVLTFGEPERVNNFETQWVTIGAR